MDMGSVDMSYTPIPRGATSWYHSTLYGNDVLATVANDRIFLLADTTNFGYSYHCYIYNQEEQVYDVAHDHRPRSIYKRKGDVNMNTIPNMPNIGGMARMDFNGANIPTAPAQAMNAVNADASGSNEGIDSRKEAIRRNIVATAVTHGYIAGYVVANAPKVEIAAPSSKTKATTAPRLFFRETKPSRILSVMMSLPKKCVMQNGSLATPDSINDCKVDYDAFADGDNLNIAATEKMALAYLAVLGDRLPEYRPTTEQGGPKSKNVTQWTPNEIYGGAATYVKAHYTLKDNVPRASLKTTSKRGALFTEHNVCCLSATKHHTFDMSKLTDDQVKQLNDSCFFYKRHNANVAQKPDGLSNWMASYSEQIWDTTYKVVNADNSETEVKGIGSIFFNKTDKEGKPIAQHEYTYLPWYMTGYRAEKATRLPVTRLVARTMQTSKSSNTERLVVTKIKLSPDTMNDAEFAPYAAFLNMITGNNGFLSLQSLFALNTRSSSSSSNSNTELSASKRKELLQSYSNDTDLREALRALQNDTALRLRAAGTAVSR